MLLKYNATLPVYLERIEKIAPLLNQLGKHIKTIWLNQYPSISDYAKFDEVVNQVFPEMIQKYNEAVRPIIK